MKTIEKPSDVERGLMEGLRGQALQFAVTS